LFFLNLHAGTVAVCGSPTGAYIIWPDSLQFHYVAGHPSMIRPFRCRRHAVRAV